mmetsp:Transcript_32341/g.126757  ORF Transcript_32341/g.126757 Transcript_32341/m.126757 type:complete len:340 (-) Transcript_32341:567-1586(-)
MIHAGGGARVTAPKAGELMRCVASDEDREFEKTYPKHLAGDHCSTPRKKARIENIPVETTPTKGGAKGLRALSKSLVSKIYGLGKVNCSDVADELALEMGDEASPLRTILEEGQRPMDMPGYDKNVRRRVYDALNVLVAVGAIAKDGKFIEWKGVELNRGSSSKREYSAVKSRIEDKRSILNELRMQHTAFQRLGARNRNLMLGDSPPRLASRVNFPFALVKSALNGDISLETTEDQRMMHFCFSSKFDLLTDAEIVLMMMNNTKLFQESQQLIGSFPPTDPPAAAASDGIMVNYPFIARSSSPLQFLNNESSGAKNPSFDSLFEKQFKQEDLEYQGEG